MKANSVVILCKGILTVLIVTTCEPLFGNLCINLLPSHSDTHALRRFDRFFFETKSFSQLIERTNGFPVDPANNDFKTLIQYLRSTVITRVNAVESHLKAPEEVSISTLSSPGDVVIKFHRSKSYIILNLNKLIRRKIYDHKWDRDTIEETREAFSNLKQLIEDINLQISRQIVTDVPSLICRTPYCRFFQVRRQSPRGPPKGFSDLSTEEISIVQNLYQKAIHASGAGFFWSDIKDINQKTYMADWYRGGLATYLKTRGIPKHRWSNYRVDSFGEIQVNLAAEPFDAVPWGSLKSNVVSDILSNLHFAKQIDFKASAHQILKEYFETHNVAVRLADFHLINPKRRAYFIHSLSELISIVYGSQHELIAEFQKLELELERQHNEDYLEKQKYLLQIARNEIKPVKNDAYFELEGLIIPLVELNQLPKSLQEYIRTAAHVDQINENGQIAHKEHMEGVTSVFRVPFISEAEGIREHGYFDASVETNFEPYRGPQVAYFRNQNGYSRDIFEFQEVPKFMIKESRFNGPLHPEVRLRYPARLKQIKVHSRNIDQSTN